MILHQNVASRKNAKTKEKNDLSRYSNSISSETNGLISSVKISTESFELLEEDLIDKVINFIPCSEVRQSKDSWKCE